ncbi:MAG: hypothetical protein K1X89_10050 [Myxococcaceae bacterium]|nr:hypothetical protein [Myxococcaceae bacterium]
MRRRLAFVLLVAACGRTGLITTTTQPNPAPAPSPSPPLPSPCGTVAPDCVTGSPFELQESTCPEGQRCLPLDSLPRSPPDSGVLDGLCTPARADNAYARLQGSCDACGHCSFWCDGLVGAHCPVGYRCKSSPECCDNAGECLAGP